MSVAIIKPRQILPINFSGLVDRFVHPTGSATAQGMDSDDFCVELS